MRGERLGRAGRGGRQSEERSGNDFNAVAGEAEHLGESNAGNLAVLLGLDEARTGCGELGVSTGGVGAGTQVRVDQRMHRAREDLAAVDVGPACGDALLLREEGQRGLGNGGGDAKLRQGDLCLGAVRGGLRRQHLGVAVAECKRLPGKQHARAGGPEGTVGVRRDAALRAGKDGGTLRQQHAEDAFAAAAVDLPHSVEAGQVVGRGRGRPRRARRCTARARRGQPGSGPVHSRPPAAR